MARLANQIVTVCAYLTNFHPALVPTPDHGDIELASQDSDPHSDQEESESEGESIDIANSECSSVVCDLDIASFPGLLAPAFVACSTNAGEGLVKLSHVV